jgi:UPF0716 family protein affecting phage T7 exclusion
MRRSHFALATLCLVLFLTFLDNTIVSAVTSGSFSQQASKEVAGNKALTQIVDEVVSAAAAAVTFRPGRLTQAV